MDSDIHQLKHVFFKKINLLLFEFMTELSLFTVIKCWHIGFLVSLYAQQLMKSTTVGIGTGNKSKPACSVIAMN